MKCKVCGSPTRVLETRGGDFNTTVRRRECVKYGHRFATYEVGSAPYNNLKSRAALYAQAENRRIERWQRNQRIVDDPRPSSEVAADLGLPASTVRHIRRTHL